jgi:hypothetical protein
MNRVVLHLHESDLRDGRLGHGWLSVGQQLSIHVSMRDGSTEFYDYSRRAGKTEVRATVNSSSFPCGCP